jgi:PleD family two-component response regulator
MFLYRGFPMFPKTAPGFEKAKRDLQDVNQRVLVVEDDRDIAQLVELHLKDLGCRCVIARDGDSGLEKALKNEYDLIILDLMLPVEHTVERYILVPGSP